MAHISLLIVPHLTILPLGFRSSLSLTCKLSIVLLILGPRFLHHREKQSLDHGAFLKAGSGIKLENCGNGRTFQRKCLLAPLILPSSPDCSAPVPCMLPGLATSKDCELSSPTTGPPLGYPSLHPMSQACCKHVQACLGHGHFHLAACATQVRWRVARAAPTPCLAVELSGGSAWFPSHSLSLERN